MTRMLKMKHNLYNTNVGKKM